MIKTMQGNILDIPNIYICHQVSHEKITISDLTQQIKEKWPEAYNDYRTLCIQEKDKIDYDSFEMCLRKIKAQANKEKDIIRFPYKIGCNLIGGEWSIIQGIIHELFWDYNIEFYTTE